MKESTLVSILEHHGKQNEVGRRNMADLVFLFEEGVEGNIIFESVVVHEFSAKYGEQKSLEFTIRTSPYSFEMCHYPFTHIVKEPCQITT